MAPRLVNTAPGESTEAVRPGQHAHLGLKSELLKVPLASFHVSMGLSNVIHRGTFPEDDLILTALGGVATLETSERRRPVDGITSRSLVGGNLVFTKNNLLDGEQGIYEVAYPIQEGASCLATFRFKTKTAWTPFSADWMTLSNMTGMYFGLEHGTFNTAVYTFLRANSPQGSLVVGGPLPAYNTTRPGQFEILPSAPHAATPGFAWRSLPNNSVVEIYIFFNVAGYASAPLPSVPTNVPLVEIWTKTPSDVGPVVQAYLPVGSFGTFPSSTAVPAFTNSRAGPSQTATIFFGNIARTAGSDVLELEDWALYPDFRVAVRDGLERPNHNLIAYPDTPVEYKASRGELLTVATPGRWFPDSGALMAAPVQSMYFQPGRREFPLYTFLEKTTTPATASFHKSEPRLEERADGIMVEAFMAGEVISKVAEGTGFGFSVEDGLALYQVLAVETTARRYFALCKDLSNLDNAALGYYVPSSDADFTSLKLVRLVVDRRRPASIGGGKAQLYVDEDLVVTADLSSDTFPASSSSNGQLHVGHLGLLNNKSRLNLASLTYMPRYLAWEGVDLLVPNDVGMNSGVAFTLNSSGVGSHAMVGEELEIVKEGLGGSTRRLFSRNQTFAEIDGMMADFRMRVVGYGDFGGAVSPVNAKTGVSFTVHLGNKKVSVGFYDCGPYGKRVAILPPGGDENEIIAQTPVGRALSAPVDWTAMNSYRLIVKGRDRVDLIIGSKTNPPSISLAWQGGTQGFDLPADVSAPRLEFGHSGTDTTSVSRWQYVRWGLSNGYETAVQQEYPAGYPKYLFGGRILIKSEFDEA